MTESTGTFEAQRGHLLGIAYRMLGEMAAAEDVVQEAWIRWQRTNAAEIKDVRAWLSTVTIRLSLDALRAARARRESYVGPWLPEPILPDDLRALAADGPAEKAELASDLSLALLHVLERLSPEERAAFILHDAFDCDYPEIAATLGKSEAACRKLVSRARERVRAGRPRFQVSDKQHRALLERFAQATATQDASQLAQFLAPDVVFYSDGGGRATAALLPVYGADKVSRLVAGLLRKFWQRGVPTFMPLDLNGHPGLVLTMGGQIISTMNLESDGECITAFYVMRNPDKLGRVAAAISRQPPGLSPSARQ